VFEDHVGQIETKRLFNWTMIYCIPFFAFLCSPLIDWVSVSEAIWITLVVEKLMKEI